jgi:hypothetical protein
MKCYIRHWLFKEIPFEKDKEYNLSLEEIETLSNKYDIMILSRNENISREIYLYLDDKKQMFRSR